MTAVPTILPDTASTERDRAGELCALDRARALGMISEMEHKLRLALLLRRDRGRVVTKRRRMVRR